MYRRLPDPSLIDTAPVSFRFEGQVIEAHAQDSVAGALLAAGIGWMRTAANSGERRAPWCMMGTCFECLVDIDGLGRRQACLTPVRDGMDVRRAGATREPLSPEDFPKDPSKTLPENRPETSNVDVLVIGAGPAGLAAAATAAECELSVLLIDEQTHPGGQIYRRISPALQGVPPDGKVGGADRIPGLHRKRGDALIRRFRTSTAAYAPGTAVWRIDDDGTVACRDDRGAWTATARRIIIATGAMERPTPLPGWTLPGVMGTGAAQIMLKSTGAVPAGRTVLAGSGPLLLLAALQLRAAGTDIAGVLQTTRRRDFAAAAPLLPRALQAYPMLAEGAAMMRTLRRSRLPVWRGCQSIEALGEEHVEAVRFQAGGSGEAVVIETETLLVHEGVIPATHLSRQAGCRHLWREAPRHWEPETDAWGATDRPRIAVAGDTAGILGAEAAALSGEITALDAAFHLGCIDMTLRDRLARPLHRRRQKLAAIRPLLDRLYRPPPEMLAPAEDRVMVCRCEEVRVGEIRGALRLGATGPNQLKAFTRCGMGPCQGRMCAATAGELIARERRLPVPEVGSFRIRPPVKPVSIGALAALDQAETAGETPASPPAEPSTFQLGKS